MSHLRAPAARADRREGGGRHGRPVARTLPAVPETHIRPQLLRLAVLPPVAVALSACAAVLFAVRSSGTRPGLSLWAVLAGAASVAGAGIVIAAVAAGRAARGISERIGALRRNSARGEADLRSLVEALRRGDAPPQRKTRGQPPADADEFELLAADLARAQLSSQAGSRQKLEVFVNLARRLQSLVHREISILDELENEMEDPDLLKGLFHVDHLATRIRRHAENLAVLGGAVSRRQWSNPVPMTEVLRSAIAEVEQYSRVKLVPPVDGEVRGHAVADVIHLLAELVENATVFSAPHTQVLLRANLVTSGLAVEVEDRGLGMPVEEQHRMNALLADPDQVNVGRLLADGRIGLFVVSQLARRHGIRVRLQSNIYGGVQAVLVVPQDVLGAARGADGSAAAQPGQEGVVGGTGPAPAGTPAALPPAAPEPRTAPAAPQPSPRTSPTGDPGPVAATTVPHAGHRRADRDPADVPAAPHHPEYDTSDPAGPPRPVDLDTRAPAAAPPAPRAARDPDGPPAPLPVRGRHEDRVNPAAAPPGIHAEDRPAVEDDGGSPALPRVGPAHGTAGPPRLPRRRAREHLVPQLRGGPASRPESEQPAGHDPGLMAAFQRGIGLAEAGPGPRPDAGPPPESTTPTARRPADEPPPAASEARAVPTGPASGAPRARDGRAEPGPEHTAPTTRHDGSAPAG
ncbi:ATP-binding protein [Streptomyces actuosus]|uniref:histidine kinase n=1 Tax=Streptomyces actuosus TaxID=1885 RepID=A0ABS2VIW6_STRAS|nr:ATP-binding protein [Streptomyces actuosus]MBN0043034.1 ATP-binding protein [Streptomyces actuosus]